ncbi:hypothetical protein DDZ18_08930 [Marinicauda salina]|uniref:TIR domain-containing protein n=1 Tax=Marinicauda salina TaxID=2135793 RepID=A0A2U2BUU8_9PROT|nr:TIR domain-containing protein [Marinicauda salina]PWE17767.1 hypothetical protein DDZ18_08930 [Marinicauda salina]
MARDPWGQYAYKAFISYNHKDVGWAEWLETELEAFRVPIDLIGAWAPPGPVPSGVSPVFRDRTSLAAGSHLDDGLRETLDASASLIVVCSPNSAKSDYVNEEVAHFKRSGKGHRIFPIIVGGEPFDKKNECFVEALKREIDPSTGELTKTETAPIAADARKEGEGRDEAFVKLVAGLLGVDVGELREKHNVKLEQEKAEAVRRAKIATYASLAALVLMVIAGGIGVGAYQQRQSALARESELVARYVQKSFGRGEEVVAAALLAEVLPTTSGALLSRPETPEAIELAADLLDSRVLTRTLNSHEGPVRMSALSPDGTRIATASADGAARVWDAETGERLALIEHEGEVASVVFSRDGARVLTASADGTARVSDAETGEQIAVFSQEAPLRAAVFDSAGARVATAGEDGTARVWRLSDGEQVVALDHDDAAVVSLAFRSDGRQIVTIAADGAARLWDPVNGRLTATMRHDSPIRTARFSPRGWRLVTASGDGPARVWRTNGGALLDEVRAEADAGLESAAMSAAFSPLSDQLITTSSDNAIRIWDARPGVDIKLGATLRGHSAAVWDAVYSADESVIITAARDDTIRVWDPETEETRGVLRLAALSDARANTHSGDAAEPPAGQIALSADGSRLVTLAGDHRAAVWSLDALSAGARASVALDGHGDRVRRAVFDPLGETLATGSDDKDAAIWDASGERLSVYSGHAAPVRDVAVSPDGAWLATASDDGTAIVWNRETGKLEAMFEGHEGPVLDLAWAPDGAWLATASADRTVRLWDVGSDAPTRVLRDHGGGVRSVAISPDGTQIATGSEDGVARLWSVETGEVVSALRGHAGWIRRVAFSGDGSRLVSASDDTTAVVWELATGRRLQIFRHGERVNWAEFSPARAEVVTASADGAVRLWDVRTGFERSRLAETAGEVFQASFSPDAGRLVIVADDGPPRLLDLPERRVEASVESVRSELASLDVQRTPEALLQELGLNVDAPPPFERYGLLDWRWWFGERSLANRLFAGRAEES